MAKNYYSLLGLKSDASEDQIKKAFREKAKQFHPDHFGDNCVPFQDIQEAYAILSNPDRRCNYNRTLREVKNFSFQINKSSSPSSYPYRESSNIVNPDSIILSTIFKTRFPLFGEIFDELQSHFWDWEYSFWGKPPIREVEIILSPEEAFHGESVRLMIPVCINCRSCSGRGRAGSFVCSACGGRGTVVTDKPVTLLYPAGIRNNTSRRISPDAPGVPDFYLQVVFKVSHN